MLFAVDISNTSVKIGIFCNEELIASWRLATEAHKLTDDYAVLILNLLQIYKINIHQIKAVIISCVVPSLKKIFHDFSEHYFCIKAIDVNHSLNLNIKLSIDNPNEVGGDRIATAVALRCFYPNENLIAITFGTATVFDCLSSEGEYLGGAIAPGMSIAMNSLVRSARQLHEVALLKPPKVIATNTAHMMQSGIIFGYAGLVEGLVKRIKKNLSSNANELIKVIATGWLADMIALETKSIHEVKQNLLLQGLRFIYEINQ